MIIIIIIIELCHEKSKRQSWCQAAAGPAALLVAPQLLPFVVDGDEDYARGTIHLFR